MPDDKDNLGEPASPQYTHIVTQPLIKRDAEDAIEPDPMSDEIERLQREAEPSPKLCPHCGKELPRE